MNVTEPLKIGFVLDDGLDNPDGVQQYILALGGWLQTGGHEVHYLVGETSRRDIANVHSMSRNVAVRFNGNSLSIPLPTGKRKLRRFLRDHNFDVLHVQVPHSPFMAQRLILAADREHTAIIGTFHIAPNNPLVTIGNTALGWWLRPSLRRFDTMFSVSPAAADFARKTFGLSSEISPNVIDYERFHAAKPFTRLKDGRPTILFLGRLVPRKGCMLLLQSIRQLAQRKDVPPFKVLVCGRGLLEHDLRQFVKHHGLEKIVEFEGFVSEDDKPRYYASADISVFPSHGGESFGIVLLEAMASGRSAVLAGNNPGYHSVLSSRPELLFDPKSVDILSDRLSLYLRDAALRKEIRQWGAEFTKNFDVSVVGEHVLSEYYKALQKRRNP